MPTAIQIAAPAAGVVFTCDDEIPLRSYRLKVVDAESHESVTPWSVRICGQGVDSYVHRSNEGTLFQMAEGVGFEWWMIAKGYRIGHGTEQDFEVEGDEATATCVLRRGFGARLTVESWTGMAELAEVTVGRVETRWNPEALAGAEILVDGVRVATSDERGIAEVELSAEPERIDVRLAGWRVVDSYGFRNGKVTFPEARCRMIRE